MINIIGHEQLIWTEMGRCCNIHNNIYPFLGGHFYEFKLPVLKCDHNVIAY